MLLTEKHVCKLSNQRQWVYIHLGYFVPRHHMRGIVLEAAIEQVQVIISHSIILNTVPVDIRLLKMILFIEIIYTDDNLNIMSTCQNWP